MLKCHLQISHYKTYDPNCSIKTLIYTNRATGVPERNEQTLNNKCTSKAILIHVKMNRLTYWFCTECMNQFYISISSEQLLFCICGGQKIVSGAKEAKSRWGERTHARCLEWLSLCPNASQRDLIMLPGNGIHDFEIFKSKLGFGHAGNICS